MKSRVKKRLSVSMLMLLAFMLFSTAGAAQTIRVGYSKSLTVGVGNCASINLTLNPVVTNLKIKYSSRNSGIASVSNLGIVTGVRKGTTTITTKIGNKSLHTTVKVCKTNTGTTQINPAPLASSAPAVSSSLNVPGCFVSVGSELDAVNRQRAASGLSPLTINADLLQAAQVRAYEASVSFSHTRPNGSSALSLIRETIPGSGYTGENLAKAYGSNSSDPQYIVNLWMDSPGHRANILNAHYDEIAIAAYQAPNGTVYWSQLFLGN